MEARNNITVVAVELFEEDCKVFDIEVDRDHSFIVGDVVVHNSTLEGACPICAALNGLVWLLPEEGDTDADYIPDGHDTVFPGATVHWNCRCTQTAVTYSFKELADMQAAADNAQ